MHQVELTMSVQAPAAAVWSVLSDFGGFLNWVTIEGGKIRLEGEGVGMIRHLTTPLGELGEQLTRLDHETQQLGYKIAYGEPIGMKAYEALVTVTARNDTQCEVTWSGNFMPADPSAVDDVKAALSSSYQNMHQALTSYTLNQS